MAKAKRGVRLRVPERRQVEFTSAAVDDLLPADHWVRLVWAHIDRLDLSEFHADIKAVEHQAGRDATDPRILLCLWVVALSEGIGSARRVEELCERDLIYRWVCGGVTVNRDLLAHFRSNSRAKLDVLLTQTVAALMKTGIVTLNAVAQDGMKVRASAGASSFRREQTLGECLEAAQNQLRVLEAELQKDSSAVTQRDAARKRAAEEKLAAIERAMAEMPAVVAAKETQKNKTRAKKSEPRVSTTDPEARVMKMADGGFRPAFNPQFATDVDSGVVVGMRVTNKGTDAQEAEPVIADVRRRYQRTPDRYLVDGGYASHLNIEALTRAGIEVFAPVRKPTDATVDPYAPLPSDSPEVKQWRERMATDRGKAEYKNRASTAERVNAELRKTGLQQLTVRGLEKVSSAILLSVLAFNIVRTLTLLA